MKINQINKEDIAALTFNNIEVLTSNEQKFERSNLLKQGAILGNAYKHKLKILFRTSEGTWAVYTTIWMATEYHVQLKGGIMIPVNAIQNIILTSI